MAQMKRDDVSSVRQCEQGDKIAYMYLALIGTILASSGMITCTEVSTLR